jgi:hypothetical protein
MALKVTNLSEISPARANELLTFFTQLVQEKYPNIELSRGVFHDLVLYFNSVLNIAVQENVERILQSNSLLNITTNPALADPALVDKVLSNYNLTRYEGGIAAGEAAVITRQLATTIISNDVILSANGVQFVPTQTFTGILPGTPATAPGDRTLIPTGDGTYAFTISIRAVTSGDAGNLKRGTLLIPNSSPSNVIRIFAAADFTTGANTRTNEEYIAELPNGLSAKTVGGRRAISATIKTQEEFKNIQHISVVGFGDPEQKRDQHGLIPVSGGGRVDLYVQTARTAQKVENFLTAVYIGPAAEDSAAGTVWQIIVPKDVTPGFYDVYSVTKIDDQTNSGYALTTYDRGYNFNGLDYAPDIINIVEAEFTRYKTAVFRFVDTDTPATAALIPGQTAAVYSVTLRAMPLISSLQDFMSSRDIRSASSDIVVKAAVPCFTTIDFKILKKANEPDPNIDAIKAEIVAAISSVGFGGNLNASTIATAAHKYLVGSQSVDKIDMFGRIIRPDGKTIYMRDFSKIVIPNDPERLVSPKTTVFLTDVDDISIAIEVVAGFNA